MKKFITALVASCSLAFCMAQHTNSQTSVKDIEWFHGSWVGLYNKAPFYEAWRKVSDSVMVNFTIEIKGTDTIVKENGAIMLRKNSRRFIGGDAIWTVDSLTAEKIVLRNDTLQYANRIIWSHSPNDHWLTEIHNPKSVIKYDLERVPWLEEVVIRFIRKAGRQ